MNKPFNAVLYILLLLFVLAIATVAIRDGSVIMADLGHYIVRLFSCADLSPRGRGFGCFLQLIAIALFVGWTIYRFRGK